LLSGNSGLPLLHLFANFAAFLCDLRGSKL